MNGDTPRTEVENKAVGMKRQPLYKSLSEELLSEFETMKYYSPFPSEREICEQYRVSRPTVRMALELLEEGGKVVRLPGKGTFFTGNRPYVDHQLAFAKGFYKDAQLQGHTARSKVLFQNVEKAPGEVAEQMGIAEGDTVFRLERLRYLDDEIYSLTNSYLPVQYLPLLTKVDFTSQSLYDALSAHGVIPSRGRQCLTFEPASAYEAMVMGLLEGEPLSVMSSRMYTAEGNLIEFVRVQSPAYKTRYEMTVDNDGLQMGEV